MGKFTKMGRLQQKVDKKIVKRINELNLADPSGSLGLFLGNKDVGLSLPGESIKMYPLAIPKPNSISSTLDWSRER